MGQLSIQQRIFIVTHYFKTSSFREVQRLFEVEYPDQRPPHKTTITRKQMSQKSCFKK